jgi:putative flavoprotein involved in K+ transport
VTSLTRIGGVYIAKDEQEAVEARQVVIATGPFDVPFTPPIAAQLDPDVHQLHSADYRRPDALPPGRVLVVGAANSGCQIALELAATRSVDLSVGRRFPTIPQGPLGRDVWSWATSVRLDRVTADSRLGRRLAQRDQIIGAGSRQLARRHQIRIRPRVSSVAGRRVTFDDGGTGEYDTVVWATGFTKDNTWIDVPGVRDERGRLRQSRGVTPSWPIRTRAELAAHPRLRAPGVGGRRRRPLGRTDRIHDPMNSISISDSRPWWPTAVFTISATTDVAALLPGESHVDTVRYPVGAARTQGTVA